MFPPHPLPQHQSPENDPIGGKKWSEGCWCHSEMMGIPQNLSPPPATSEVAPHTIVEKLLGEAQGMGDVSSLDEGEQRAHEHPPTHSSALLGSMEMGLGLVAVP